MTSLHAQMPRSVLGLQHGDLIGGKYRVDGLIGQGGMGVVLHATHLDLERPVAIKLVRADLADREEIIARMLFEARIAAKIRSEHVARVLDVGRLDSGVPYIVMEYLEGSDLSTLLEEQQRLPVALACDFVIQACEALAEAHAAGIIHRDLKPANLFVTTRADGTPTIKVLDFGISKDIGSATRRSAVTNSGGSVGSPHYMAPEQMRRGQPIDPRADIWALGAILFELITGKPAFDAELLPAVCARVLEEEPAHACDLLADVPAALDAVIWRCLRKDPALRYDSVALLARELAPFGSPGSALYAERVSRISATTRERSVIQVPMSSRQSSLMPRSLAPIALTPSKVLVASGRVHVARDAAAPVRSMSELTPTGVIELVDRRRPSVMKRLTFAASAACAFALAFAAWNRFSFWPGSEPQATARGQLSMFSGLPLDVDHARQAELPRQVPPVRQPEHGFADESARFDEKPSEASQPQTTPDATAPSRAKVGRRLPAARWKWSKASRKKPRPIDPDVSPSAAASRSRNDAAAAFPEVSPIADLWDTEAFDSRK